jgi:murein L,D-transpeptidase YcbB/YkuD
MLGIPCDAAAQDAEISKVTAAPSAEHTGPTNDAPALRLRGTEDPLAVLDPADRVIAEKMRDLLAAKADRIFPARKERQAVEAFYQSRNMVPLWLDKGIENARARSAVARLKIADTDGLDPADYRTPSLGGPGADALAEAELKLTQAVLTYARHVQAGRFPYSRISRNIELMQAPPDPAEVLAKVAAAADIGKALDEFSPPQEPYRRLKAMLAQLRAMPSAARKEPAEAPAAAGERPRRRAGEPIPREAAALSRERQIETVMVNMERWRWYPRDLGAAHVEVNQPDFTLKVMHDGKEVWTTRVVIGKPSMPTPLLSETMKYITINPTWHVPPSIVHNEYLPALAQDPTVLSRMGLRVHYSGGGVEITMPPGDNNALGRIRFNFPNRFLVYQHDTPDKHMFGHEVRAYSHGCMRVQDPAKYAEVLLNLAHPEEHWTAERIKRMFGSSEQDLQIQPVPVWVHLTYQTAFVDDAGKLQLRRDVYGLDARLLAAIRSERGVVEPPGERTREPEVASLSGAPRARPLRHSFLQPMFYDGPRHVRPRPPRGIYYR